MTNVISTTIDSGGRVVLPKAMRERLGLQAGSAVEVSEADGEVRVRPAPVELRLVRKGSVTVIESSTPLPAIDDGYVRAILESVRGV